jgi:hypothetical protein
MYASSGTELQAFQCSEPALRWAMPFIGFEPESNRSRPWRGTGLLRARSVERDH